MNYISREMVMLYGIILTFGVGVVNFFLSRNANKRTVFVNAITSERVKWMGELKELIAEYLSLTTFYEKKPLLEKEDLITFLERLIYLKNRIRLHLNYIDENDKEIIDLIEKINTKIFGIYDSKDILKIPIETRINALPPDKKIEIIGKAFSDETGKNLINNLISNSQQDSQLIGEVMNKIIKTIDVDFKKNYGYQGREDLIKNTNQLVVKVQIYLKREWEKVKEEADKGNFSKNSWYGKIMNWLKI